MQSVYQIDSKSQSCVAYLAKTQAIDELIMCQGESVEANYEKHLDETLRSTKSYFPDKVKLVENAFHETIGDTWILIIHEKQAEIIEMIQRSS